MSEKSDLEALQQEVEALRTILDTLPDLVFLKDAESRFIFINAAGCALSGKEREDIIGKTDFDLHDAESAKLYYEREQAILRSGVPLEEIEKPNAETSSLSRKFPVYDADGKPKAIVGISRDVQQLKLMEEQVKAQQKRIAEQEKALAELAVQVIPLMDGIVLLPLTGAIDSTRAQSIMRGLLAGISQYRAKIVLLDITGVDVVDTGVADALNKTVQAIRLKGAQTVITGISEAVAETIVDLGIDWRDFETVGTLQDGLRLALQRLGAKI